MNVNGVNVSSPEFVDACDEDQLHRLIDLARDRLKKLNDAPKESFWVITDGWQVFAYFRSEDKEKAREEMIRRIQAGAMAIEMQHQKFREEEIKDWLV